MDASNLFVVAAATAPAGQGVVSDSRVTTDARATLGNDDQS